MKLLLVCSRIKKLPVREAMELCVNITVACNMTGMLVMFYKDGWGTAGQHKTCN
jgi:hypothetical protein